MTSDYIQKLHPEKWLGPIYEHMSLQEKMRSLFLFGQYLKFKIIFEKVGLFSLSAIPVLIVSMFVMIFTNDVSILTLFFFIFAYTLLKTIELISNLFRLASLRHSFNNYMDYVGKMEKKYGYQEDSFK